MHNANSPQKLSLPAKASVWYTASAILERGGSLIFTPIFTRILTAEEFGIYPLYLSWMGIFTVLCTLEIGGAIVYRALTRFQDADEFFSSALGLLAVSALSFTTLYIIFKSTINAITGLSTALTLLLIIQVFLTGIQGIYLCGCRYVYRYRKVAAINLFSAIASPLLTLLLIKLTPIRAEARIVAPLIVCTATAIPILVGMLKKCGRLFSPEIWKYLIRLAIPQLPHFISATLSVQLGRIIVGRSFGQSELAKYSVAFSIGFLLSVISAPIVSALCPWINRKLMRGEIVIINTVASRIFSLFSILTLILLCISPEIMALLAPTEYREALFAIFPIAVSIPFSFLSSLIHTVQTYYERTYLNTASSVATALITLMLNLSLTLRLGYKSAAAIILISSIAQLGFSILTLRGSSKTRFFPLSIFARSVCLVLLTAPLIFLFRDIRATRVLLSLALLISLLPRTEEYRALIRER